MSTMNNEQRSALAHLQDCRISRGFRSDEAIERDLAHERDMEMLRREQLRADIEEALAEIPADWD